MNRHIQKILRIIDSARAGTRYINGLDPNLYLEEYNRHPASRILFAYLLVDMYKSQNLDLLITPELICDEIVKRGLINIFFFTEMDCQLIEEGIWVSTPNSDRSGYYTRISSENNYIFEFSQDGKYSVTL